MITDRQLFAFTQFVGDVIGQELEKTELINHAVCYFCVCPKDAKELVVRCEEQDYIVQTDSGYRIATV